MNTIKKWGIVIIVIILSIWGIYFLMHRQGNESQQKPKNTSIIAFGDSLVAGQGATKSNDFVSVLSQKVNVPIENFGHNGDTSADALERVDTVLDRDPGIVILLIGGNDILRRVPIETTKENISTIIEALRKNNTIVILVGVRGAIFSDPYDPMYQSIADEYKIIYVPNILSGLIGHSDLMSDPIHPNDKGYAQIGERLSKVLSPLIQ